MGQSPQAQFADVTFEPFVAQEQAEARGPLTAHYQAPLIDGIMAFMEVKSGVYTPCDPPASHVPYPCGPDAWNWEMWNDRAFTWLSPDGMTLYTISRSHFVPYASYLVAVNVSDLAPKWHVSMAGLLGLVHTTERVVLDVLL